MTRERGSSVLQQLSVPGKVSAHLLLMQTPLLKLQRPEQPGITLDMSTIDRVPELRMLVERRREFRQGMTAAFVTSRRRLIPCTVRHSKTSYDSMGLL